MEAHFASGKPTVVFATTGPGITNVITGLTEARWEGAKVILVCGTTSPLQRGRFAFQETSAYTMPGFFTKGGLFDFAAMMEDPDEIEEIAARLAAGLSRPGGFVGGIAVPVAIQTAPARRPLPALLSSEPAGISTRAVAAVADMLIEEPFAIWAGFGARHAAAQVRALAEHMGAPVMCTPRAKGIFPERHPLYLGVTGLGGQPRIAAELARRQITRALVLGSRLGEWSSFWDHELVPPGGLIHVDVDPEVPGAAFPSVRTHAVQAEIGAFLDALLASLPASDPSRIRTLTSECPPSERRTDGLVRPRVLLDAIQRKIVDASDAIVIPDTGNALAWATHWLRFPRPGRFRISVAFASMGHAAAGVVGAAIGSGGKAVALVGDGAMLMVNEVSTAVAREVPAVWVVLNDARYGMTTQGMKSVGFEPAETSIPRVDFVMMARAVGADGVRVEHEAELDAALDAAMRAAGPFVVDVHIDPDEAPPVGRRNKALADQWASGGGGSNR
jgi:acetolactate synthase-1/2/3 large subunit